MNLSTNKNNCGTSYSNLCETNPFFTDIQDVSGRYDIAPVAKVLMAYYGCSPSTFLDYFQMSQSTARQCFLKFCRIVSSDNDLQSVYARRMTRSDARRLSALHEAVHGIFGMIGSLDSLCWVEKLSCGVAGFEHGKIRYANNCVGSVGGSQLVVPASFLWLSRILEQYQYLE